MLYVFARQTIHLLHGIVSFHWASKKTFNLLIALSFGHAYVLHKVANRVCSCTFHISDHSKAIASLSLCCLPPDHLRTHIRQIDGHMLFQNLNALVSQRFSPMAASRNLDAVTIRLQICASAKIKISRKLQCLKNEN